MRRTTIGGVAVVVALGAAGLAASPAAWSAGPKAPAYDTTTLAGKVASVHGTAGLQVRMSAFLEEEALPDTKTSSTSSFVTRRVRGAVAETVSIPHPCLRAGGRSRWGHGITGC